MKLGQVIPFANAHPTELEIRTCSQPIELLGRGTEPVRLSSASFAVEQSSCTGCPCSSILQPSSCTGLPQIQQLGVALSRGAMAALQRIVISCTRPKSGGAQGGSVLDPRSLVPGSELCKRRDTRWGLCLG